MITIPDAFRASLEDIVGRPRVLTGDRSTLPYRKGFRAGQGGALAVVQPRTLVEMWRVLGKCVGANKVVILQAANTGLTGGSTPDGDDYDGDVIIISTLLMRKIFVIDQGRQVVCLAGATLHQLERVLAPMGREPHSVIGSSCIGASVVGGVCNNSGGALTRRGPAFTQLALFARLDGNGHMRLVNHLGLKLGREPEEILDRLERGAFDSADIVSDAQCHGADHDYERRVRDVDSDRPARFNADPGRLFEAAGSAGRVAVFAVRLDTFPKDERCRVFYVGTNDPGELTALRRHALQSFKNLPVAGEYMHRAAFDMAEAYGKDTYLAIKYLGTEFLPRMFRLKAWVDGISMRFGTHSTGLSDRVLQIVSQCFPAHVPLRIRQFKDQFEHHLMIKTAGDGIEETEGYLRSVFPSRTGAFFECTDPEAEGAFLLRYAVAGAAVRFRTLRPAEVEDIVALDFALPRNERDWFEPCPEELARMTTENLLYGHFFCHVFHQDFVVAKGCDLQAFERIVLATLDRRRAEYPAEHNVGHVYKAKPALATFYRELDPLNRFNPGIGQTSKRRSWR